ncbi:MAG: DUF6552 family protein [Burkholderiaceae bacterium]
MTFDNCLKWGSTALLLVGSVLTSFNVFPFNIIFSFGGNAGWLWAGFRMKETSLWSLQLVLTAVYGAGLLAA